MSQPMQPQQPQQAPPEAPVPDLAERVRELEERLAASEKRAALVPLTTIPTHGAGPGYDNSQPSWGLAAQEAASRGEWYEEWGDKPA